MITFVSSHILTALTGGDTIGSKVVNPDAFLSALDMAVATHDTSRDRVAGQHYVQLPQTAWTSVSAGVGRKSENPADYLVRMHRGQACLFLRRELAAEVEGLACVVYTREAYLNDPDVQGDAAEIARIEASDCSHVIVAVIASSGPQAPLTPYRLVANLAGGNNEDLALDADAIREKARVSKAYWDEWCVVAD